MAAGTRECGMVPIPGGTFTMGEASPAYDAAPVQSNVTVGNFAIDAYEVTVARFRLWVTAGRPVPSGPVMYRGGPLPFEGTVNTVEELRTYYMGTAPDSRCNWNASDREDHPINCVNWSTAQAFCVWDGGRLPTQAEWEFAARGSAGRIFPWGGMTGDTPTNAQACWSGAGMSRTSTCVVGSLPAGDAPGGIHDLAGNVWEWNADRYSTYFSMPPDGGQTCWDNTAANNTICNERGSRPGVRVLRGGSWGNTYAADLRAASRGYVTPAYRTPGVGFRCARDTP